MSDEELNRRLEHIEEQIDGIREDLDEIKLDRAKFRGALGAVLLVVTVVVSGVKLLWGFLKDHLTWQ